MAKILVGGILQETNTYSPLKETYASFNQYRGQALMEYPHTSPARIIAQRGHTVVPGVYASIIPSGLLTKDEYLLFVEDFMSYCTDDIDGIWLSMHGAMTVRDIGSAEAYLVKELRKRYGNKIPIFASLDFHANISLALVESLNYITGYYTAPHEDIYETGCRAVNALVDCIEQNRLPHCKYVAIPMVMAGELVITADPPTCVFQEKLRQLAKDENILELSLFCGFAWSDCPRNRMSITVSDDHITDVAMAKVQQIASEIWASRRDFGYGKAIAKEPEEAVALAASLETDATIMLSDTGDNITAGCAGDNALLAELMIQSKLKNALVAGLADKNAVTQCWELPIGENVALDLGGTIDPSNSKRIHVEGQLIHKHIFDAEEIPTPLRIVVVRAGGVDLLINEQRYSVTSRKRINDTGLCCENYKIIAVKLGYLFPDFAAQNPISILALTPGNAYQKTGRIPYSNGPKQYYPRDEFVYTPEFDTEN